MLSANGCDLKRAILYARMATDEQRLYASALLTCLKLLAPPRRG